MPKDAIIVNVGRGPVINEVALYTALKENKIGAAGLDVWYNYPKVKMEPVLHHVVSLLAWLAPYEAFLSGRVTFNGHIWIFKSCFAVTRKFNVGIIVAHRLRYLFFFSFKLESCGPISKHVDSAVCH